MACPVCGFAFAESQTACPRCGAFHSGPMASGPMSAGGTEPPHTFRYLLIGAFAIVALMGFGIYHLSRNSDFMRAFRQSYDAARNPQYPVRAHQPVQHGAVATPDQMEAHGKLYFLPMGRQAFPPVSLAAYYRDKFKIDIGVLPGIPLPAAAYDPLRKQYIAEEMILGMKLAYPAIVRSSDSSVILLTDEDMYPKSLGWKFAPSFRMDGRYAVISSYSNDPVFQKSGAATDSQAKLAGMHRSLSKYIGMLYFHLPISFDPTSVMYQPLDTYAGIDDLYESDLHSEESANGMRGSSWPCIFYSYSYETHAIKLLSPFVQDCDYSREPASVREEIFETQLGTGEFFQFAMDFQINSAPPIEFRRTYRSQWVPSSALGHGADDNYDSYLYSDGVDKLSFVDIIDQSGSRQRLIRSSPGKGFSPSIVFEKKQDDGELLNHARMTWIDNKFKLQNLDGSWSTFLPCSDGRCYWTGYRDAVGHELRFERDDSRNLHRLTASDNQGISFTADKQFRLTSARATSGDAVTYEYDAPGRLSRITHADGQVTLCSYDAAHRLTSISVVASPATPPVQILANEYDAEGHVSRQTLYTGAIVQFQYTRTPASPYNDVKITNPAGRILTLKRFSDFSYTVRSAEVRFPAVTPLAQAPGQTKSR